MTASAEETAAAPDRAFALLSDRTRIEIIRTVGDAAGPLSFSELRECVGARDSGRFNYHLDRLSGTCLRRTPEGYVLRPTGRALLDVIDRVDSLAAGPADDR